MMPITVWVDCPCGCEASIEATVFPNENGGADEVIVERHRGGFTEREFC